LNGAGVFREILIDEARLAPESKAELESALLVALNQASSEVKTRAKSRFSGLTGGMF